MIEILHEQLISQNKSLRRVKRWLKGNHPGLGTLIWGLTGMETVQARNRRDKTYSDLHSSVRVKHMS